MGLIAPTVVAATHLHKQLTKLFEFVLNRFLVSSNGAAVARRDTKKYI
jgi:hypothetical protein